MDKLEQLCDRAEKLLEHLERLLRVDHPEPDWHSVAFRWRKKADHGWIESIRHPDRIPLDALCCIEAQIARIEQNTRQFVHGFSANNVLLTGARGTGKSSLIKALLNKYAQSGLRLIEVEKHHLTDLHDIVEIIYQRPERFILFCDDLSFESDDPGYKALKVVLDGSLAAISENVLIYATSNRRHMIPEYMLDNLATLHSGEEVHPGEAIEEKISLSERFGLWVSFYSFDQEQYLIIVQYWLAFFGIAEITPEIKQESLQWALERGSRSGRVASQFARDFAGRRKTGDG
ncbi:MAG: ATP-binding protein [Burkholderiales bacterium]|nr:ATP-binding protein [Burkholderiales bacterium]